MIIVTSSMGGKTTYEEGTSYSNDLDGDLDVFNAQNVVIATHCREHWSSVESIADDTPLTVAQAEANLRKAQADAAAAQERYAKAIEGAQAAVVEAHKLLQRGDA